MALRPPERMTRLDDRAGRFVSFFDPDSGAYVRTGVLDEMRRDTGEDPFMASFPQLLDLGVMGHCAHGLSGRCAATGTRCYQQGGSVDQPDMRFEDFRRIVDECAGRTFQFALGGRGDPELHEDFERLLSYSREKDIVPNLTTSGYGLTAEKARIIARYCGAAAVSWYRTEATRRALALLLDAGVKTNLHVVLGTDTIDEAILMLSEDATHGGVPEGVNRVVFLLFKPVGAGAEARERVLAPDDPRAERFFSLLETERGGLLGGFDSCCVPGLVRWAPGVDPDAYDTCEGARYSAYVTPDLRILPCSFDQSGRWAVDLAGRTIEEAWHGEVFEDFRKHLREACPACAHRSVCRGGCPVVPEIVLCRDGERTTGRGRP